VSPPVLADVDVCVVGSGAPRKVVGGGTLRLLERAIEDGYADRVVVGMDAARQGYYHAYGGSPGLVRLLGPLSAMMEERGIDDVTRHALFVENPSRVFAFAAPRGGDP